jgi:hypothetical protein
MEDSDSLRPTPRASVEDSSVLPEFSRASEVRRCELLCSRLVRERLYSDAAFLLVKKDGLHTEPTDDLTFEHLCRVLVSRVTYLMAA